MGHECRWAEIKAKVNLSDYREDSERDAFDLGKTTSMA